jgi:hypothetical protein
MHFPAAKKIVLVQDNLSTHNLLQDAGDADVPALAREALRGLIAELHALEQRIEAVEAVIVREHKTNAVSRRLASIPGIGPITASAIAATVADPSAFKSGRELAAWIGLVPRQHSSGGKQKLSRVSAAYIGRTHVCARSSSQHHFSLAEWGPFTHGAVHTCDQLSAAEPAVHAPVCLADLRRRIGCHIPSRHALLRQRGGGDPGPTAPFAHHLLRRDDGAHRWPHPLELGVQNEQVVIHVIRNSRAASVVAEVLVGHRPSIWVSDLWKECVRIEP